MLRTHRSWLVLVTLALLVGCGGGGGGGGGTGTLAVAVTDAPFPGADCLAAAWITFDGVEARSEGGWVEIPLVGADAEGHVKMDLLQLTNGLSENLAVGTTPAGTYDEIRLHVVTSTLEFADGSPSRDFKIPSGSSSGLKVKIDPPLVVAAGAVTPITLDVSLVESFHTTGLGGNPTCEELKAGDGGVIFRPVVRAIVDMGLVTGIVTVDGTETGGVEVSAFPPGVVPDGVLEPVALTLSSAESQEFAPLGSYGLALPPGTYDLYLRPQGVDEYQQAATDVVVVVGEATEQDLSYTTPTP